MHISEGILSGGVLIAGWAVTCAGVGVGLKRTDPAKIVRTALLASAFFLASLVHVKIGPGSAHLLLIAPMGIILGWAVFPAVLAALMLQALLFGFGGLLVLGVNTMVMAGSALAVYGVFGRAVRERGSLAMAFIAGVSGVMLAAVFAGICLALSDSGFVNAAKILAVAHIPVALIEGAVTAFLVAWLKKAAPEFLS
ncbi:MAG: cobalt transporter CbiM [Synergistaceae bacterium]|nr:cobalt transporter CbiM [Synergistaceae bacterium]